MASSDASTHKLPENTRFEQSTALNNLVDLLLELNILERERIAITRETESSEETQSQKTSSATQDLWEDDASTVEVKFQEIFNSPETQLEEEEVKPLQNELDSETLEDNLSDKLLNVLEDLTLNRNTPLDESSATTTQSTSEPLNDTPEVEEKLSPSLDLLSELKSLNALSEQENFHLNLTAEDQTSNASLSDYKDFNDVPEEEETENTSLELPQKIPKEATLSKTSKTPQQSSLKQNSESQNLGSLLSLKEGDNEGKTEANSTKLEEKDSLYILLPLILEMLQVNETDWRESLFQALVPMIDEIIQERSLQDRRAMSKVLSGLIPAAITEEIQKHPKQIATAIAPEMALAIQEQIRLDRDAISKALASEMGRAIKAQIELERDAMVDALYPVIGSTISKYMAEFVSSINEKLENNLSPEVIQRKIRAKVKGVSEEELIFRESLPMKVQAVFLIHKDSGLVMCEVQPSETDRLESDMLAGMLTAIRSFVNDCVAREGDVLELSEIEYGDSEIVIESAGYCYIAVVIKGEKTKAFLKKVRDTFAVIVQKNDRLIEEYSGDPETIPKTVETLLLGLVEQHPHEAKQKRKKSFNTLFGLIFILLGIIFIPFSFYSYRTWLANRLETKAELALETTPELSIYNLHPELENSILILTGKVPNVYLKAEAEQVVRKVIPNRDIENQIIAVDIPPNPIATETEIQRLTNLFNQEEGVNITTVYKSGKVTVTGNTSQFADLRKITLALEEIPGVYSVLSVVQQQAPKIETQIYFSSGSARLKDDDIPTKIASVTRYLNRYPEVSLRIVGYTDEIGSDRANQQLALQRANSVKEALENQGIAPQRLQISGTSEPPPKANSEQPEWLKRTVQFDPYIPAQERENL